MSTVLRRLTEIWCGIRTGSQGTITRNPNLTAQDVITALTSTFSLDIIASEVERFLFGIVEAYDLGQLPYKQGTLVRLEMRTQALLFTAMIGESSAFNVSEHLLQEMIRTFPALEWYQTIRTIIEARRVDKADVLYALAAGLSSSRVGQIKSSAIGLVYYNGYSQTNHASPNSLDHVLARIRMRLDYLLGRQQLPASLALVLRAGNRHLESWRQIG